MFIRNDHILTWFLSSDSDFEFLFPVRYRIPAQPEMLGQLGIVQAVFLLIFQNLQYGLLIIRAVLLVAYGYFP